jgi:hypothetical protein
MAARANAISFSPGQGNRLKLSEDRGYSNFMDLANATIPDLYTILGEDLAESLLAAADDTGFHILYGDDLRAAKDAAVGNLREAARTEAEENVPEPYYEETILYGTADDYLRPSQGLTVVSGPYGWVDQAVADGKLQDILTDSMLTTPWDHRQQQRLAEIETRIAQIEADTRPGYGRTTAQEQDYQALSNELYEREKAQAAGPQTGTRISSVLEDDAQWEPPTHALQYPSKLESTWTSTSPRIGCPTRRSSSRARCRRVPGAAARSEDAGHQFVKTLTSDTWEVDLYVSDQVAEADSVRVNVQNNGLYQLQIRPYLSRKALMPTLMTANIRAKVGAKERGYPWNSNRDGLDAGAGEAIEMFIDFELMGAVVAKEHAAYQDALKDAIPLPDGDGKLFNVGRVEGQALADLQDLASRPYLATLNRHMTRLHNALTDMLAGHTWYYPDPATFQRSSFGGFGVSKDWQGLNVGIAALTPVQHAEPAALHPWVIHGGVPPSRHQRAPVRAVEGRLPSCSGAARYRWLTSPQSCCGGIRTRTSRSSGTTMD